MGEAKRRGSKNQRLVEALLKPHKGWNLDTGKEELEQLQLAVRIFRSAISADEWILRRSKIAEKEAIEVPKADVGESSSVRHQNDRIGWYLYLLETAISDLWNLDTTESAKVTPYLVGIAQRWLYKERVVGIERKLKEVMTDYRKSPDGLIFEILIALSYAKEGWSVQFIDEGADRSPDFFAEKDGVRVYVECKRRHGETAYTQEEHQHWISIWNSFKRHLIAAERWLWIDVVFHQEIKTFESDYLSNVVGHILGNDFSGEVTVHSDERSTIRIKKSNEAALKEDIRSSSIKLNGSKLPLLLGGDWASENSQTMHIISAKYDFAVAPKDGRTSKSGVYVREAKWASGVTYRVDAKKAIEKKSRHFKSLLAGAVQQLPDDCPSVIHVAQDTIEGREADAVRSEKIGDMIKGFRVNNEFFIVVHYFEPINSASYLWLIDETVSTYRTENFPNIDIPKSALIEKEEDWRPGAHWELYPRS